MKQRQPDHQRSFLLDFLLGLGSGLPPLILLLFSNTQKSCSSAFYHLFLITGGMYLLGFFLTLFLLSWKKSVSNPFLLGIFGMFFFVFLFGACVYFSHGICLLFQWPGSF